MNLFRATIAALILAFSLVGTRADARNQSDVIDSYTAFIGHDDLFNSSGTRLTEAAEILRQDRANVHDRNIYQKGDEIDGFFGEVSNREKLADMLSSGSISNDAELIIEHGNCWVNVQIFGHGDEGDYIEVEAWRK